MADQSGSKKGRPILGSGNSSNVSQSTLSVDAPAFVPRSQAPSVYQSPQQYPAGDHNYPPTFDAEENAEVEFWSEDIMGQFQQAVTLLTMQPGSVEEVLGPLTDSLNCGMTEELLQQMIDLLIEQSIFEPNFRYTGAKMCSYFTNNLLIKLQSGTFRQNLLKRCYDEYSKKDELLGSPQGCERLCGFTLFMGELLLNMTAGDGNQRIGVLVDALPELLTILLSQYSDKKIKAVVQTLKLSGSVLEGLASEKVNDVFSQLKQVVTRNDVSKTSKWMILSLVELRASNWGGEPADSEPAPQQNGQNGQNGQSNNGWVENGGGEVWSNGTLIYEDGIYPGWSPGEEGYYIDDQWEENPGMFDDEMAAAYEAFLQESANQRHRP